MAYNIANELTINIYQRLSKYAPAKDVTMTEKNLKYITQKGTNDKKGTTVTLLHR